MLVRERGISRPPTILTLLLVLVAAAGTGYYLGGHSGAATVTETSTVSATQTLSETTTEVSTMTSAQTFTVTVTSATTSPQASEQSSTSTASSSSAPELNITIGSPEIHYGGTSFDGSNESVLALEVFPLTVTSTPAQEVNLTSQNVPTDVWVEFSPSQLLASPNGTRATMTMSGGAQYSGPFSNETIRVGALSMSTYTLEPLTIVHLFNISILQSTSSPVEFPDPISTMNSSVTISMFEAVYDPSSASAPVSDSISLSVLGMEGQNGTTVPLPSWLAVTLSNATLDLVSDKPSFFMVAVNTTFAAPVGQYRLAVAETLPGGQRQVVSLEVIVASQQSSMGMSGGMSNGSMAPSMLARLRVDASLRDRNESN